MKHFRNAPAYCEKRDNANSKRGSRGEERKNIYIKMFSDEPEDIIKEKEKTIHKWISDKKIESTK